MTTDPGLLAEIGRRLAAATPDERLAMAVDEAGTGLYDDDLAEIVQYAYEPGALQDYARQQQRR